MPHVVMLNLVGEGRARADERHVPHQDIQELGQLIETGSAQETADGGDARIGGEFVGDLAVRDLTATIGYEALYIFPVDGGVVVDAHGAELQEAKLPTELTQPLLAEEDRPFGRQLDGDGNGDENGQPHDQSERTADDIHEPFGEAGQALGGGVEEQVVVDAGFGAVGGGELVPIFGKHVERESDLVDLADGQSAGKGFGYFGKESVGHGLAVGIGAEFGEDDADGGALVVPTFGIRVAAGTGEREQHFVEGLVVASGVQEAGGFQEHEHKAPAGPLGPFALDVQRAREKLPGEHPIRLNQGGSLGGVRGSVGSAQ